MEINMERETSTPVQAYVDVYDEISKFEASTEKI